jgi:glutaredoxin-dependent peroxiredoxin
VYGISVDSPYSHEAWRKHLGLPDEITLLSDFNRDFGRAYGLLRTLPSGLRDVLRRTVFVLDPEGRITYRWDQPDPPRLPNVDEVLAEVRKLASPA